MYTIHSTLTTSRLFLEFNNRGEPFPSQAVGPFDTHGFITDRSTMHFDPAKTTAEREISMQGTMDWNPESGLFTAWFWHEEAIFRGVSTVIKGGEEKYAPAGPGEDSQPQKFNGFSVRSSSETTTDLFFGRVIAGSGTCVIEPVPILPGDEIAEAVVEAVDRFLPHKLLQHLVP